MRIIELGNYLAPAYAGMLLAEQGHSVHKWLGKSPDPILSLRKGAELWAWLNEGKILIERPADHIGHTTDIDAVIDNFTPQFLAANEIDPYAIANEKGIVWVSLRSEVEQRSFDIIAQARSTLEFAPYMPFYLGDTVAGLFIAYKVVAAQKPGHYILGHASCLQKLIEGELMVDIERDSKHVPWDYDTYRYDPARREAVVEYKGKLITEIAKSRAWKLAHLFHNNGRIII